MAATSGTYYFSSASFSTATAVYTDAALSTFAPDGWYSDETIYRQQAAGILHAETTCPNCLSPSPSPAPTVTPAPTPTPAPTVAPVPTVAPTVAPVVTYDYREYTECGGSTTEIFRLESGGSFPTVLVFEGICWEDTAATSSTSTNDAAGLTDYLTCGSCTPPTPPPTVAPSPTVAPVVGTELFSTNSVGNGEGSSGAACPLQTSHSIYTSRANVASVVATDILYTNVTLTNVWNGALEWYGVTDVTAKYPDLDSGFAFLVNSSGAVVTVVDCTAPPSPTPAPTAAVFQDVTIRQCYTTAPLYSVRIQGGQLTAPDLTDGLAIKITGIAAGGNPEFTNTECWEIIDYEASSYASTASLDSTDSNCEGCGATPVYDYAEYTECYTSTTQVFRKLTTTSSWPTVLKYNVGGNVLCFSNDTITTATSSVSVESLPDYNNCFDCETPTTYSTAFAQNGVGSDTAACGIATSAYIFTSRATVALIQTGDIMYSNSAQSTVFNGQTNWYGVSNVLGQVTPDYALLIESSGEVLAKVSCAVVPTVAPTAAPTAGSTDIQIEDCNNPGATYYVTVNGIYIASHVGLALKISGGGGSPCITFDGSRCWEIKAVNTAYADCSATVLSVQSSCGGCTPVVPTVAPTASPTVAPVTPGPVTTTYYYTISRCDGGVNNYTSTATTSPLNVGQAVTMPDTLCYEVQGVGTINSNVYTKDFLNCGACTPAPTVAPTATPTVAPTAAPTVAPTATPTVAPSASCYALSGSMSTVSSAAACDSTRTETFYFDTSDFCTATAFYGTTSGCSAIYSSAAYISIGVYQRLWNGSTFSTLCTGCIG